jgi:hypothetical protein
MDLVPADVWPWILICAGVVGLGVLILLITLIMRQRHTPAVGSAHLTPAQQRALERDVSNLIAALSDMAQAVGGELDFRAGRLEKLLAAADERITRLEELSPSAHVTAPTTTAAPDARHAEVYSLADRGLSSIDIAKHLCRPKGEIELILALRPRRAG